jgi:hypothetical protein
MLVALLGACRSDESTSWDMALNAPLAQAELSLENIIPDSLIISEKDSPIVIRYESMLSLIPSDSVLKIPDTSFIEQFIFPLSFSLPAGFQVFDVNDVVRFNYDAVQLTYAEILRGFLDFEIRSTLSDSVIYSYTIPAAKLMGTPLSLANQWIVPGSVGSPSTRNGSIALDGYSLDLRGQSTNSSNQLQLELDAQLNPNGNSVPVLANQEILKFTSTFRDVVPRYAKGYFGSEQYDPGQSTTGLGVMKNIWGNLNLADIKLNLDLENSVGADFSFLIQYLRARKQSTGATLDLTHSLIGQSQRIGRAQPYPEGSLPYTTTRKSFELNTSNSNLKQLIEMLPDQLEYRITAELNPLGNVSSGNDFIYNTSDARVKLALECPLRFSANALNFRDTIDFDGVEKATESPVQNADLKIRVENGFPYEWQTMYWLLDANKVVMDSIFTGQTIAPAPVNGQLKVTQPRISELKATLSPVLLEKLERCQYLVIGARLNTVPGQTLLPAYTHYKLKFTLNGRGVYRVTLK